MTTEYLAYLPMYLFQLPQVLIFALFVAATLTARHRARAHLPWLVVMTAGWGFGMLGGIATVTLMASRQPMALSLQRYSALLIGPQVISGLGSLCLMVGAILLLLYLLGPHERVS